MKAKQENPVPFLEKTFKNNGIKIHIFCNWKFYRFLFDIGFLEYKIFQILITRFYDVMQNRLVNIKIKSSYFAILTFVIVFLSKIWNLNYNLNRCTFLANLNKRITFSIKWILKVYIVRIPNHRLFCIPWNDFSLKK